VKLMAYAGHKCKVKVSGSPLDLIDAATSTADNKTYQVTDPTKRIFAPDADIVVEEDGVPTAEAYQVNRLNGSVEFQNVDALRGVVTITGKYLALSDVAEAHEFNYALEANNESAPRFQSEWQHRQQTTKDLNAELAAWHDVNTTVFYDAITSGNTMILEFYVNDVLDLRAWCKAASDEIETAADALIEESIEFEGTTDKEKRMIYLG
jgi:hypothetical protein